MSCDVIPMIESTKGGRPVWEPVFSQEEAEFYSYPDGWSWPSTREPPRNPGYREDLQLNLTHENMKRMMMLLGYRLDETYGLVLTVDEFLVSGTRWLRGNLNSRSRAIRAPKISGGGVVLIQNSVSEADLNRNILKAVKIVREGKARGATHVHIG